MYGPPGAHCCAVKRVFAACNLSLCLYADRLSTFESCPAKLAASRVREMAYTGCYYSGSGSGQRQNEVACFACGLKMRDWQEGGDLKLEHLKASPNCRHLREACPELFARKRKENVELRAETTTW